MSVRTKLFEPIRQVLLDRSFTEAQIERVIPRLTSDYKREPMLLAQIIDRWNLLMNLSSVPQDDLEVSKSIPALAMPPKSSLMAKYDISMNTILADVEPDLLMFDPDKLLKRHTRIKNLGIIKNLGEHWTVLFNAPRGFYLQDWTELLKKIYYLEHNVIDLLYDKKEQKEMYVHPLIKSAAATESDFDHIRTRYLFAFRSGYGSLIHMYGIQSALNRPTLKDIILSDNDTFLSKFAPFCSPEEYNCFANLLKAHEIDDDDADIYEKLSELGD